MRCRRMILLVFLALSIIGCGAAAQDQPVSINPLPPVTAKDLQIVTGQRIYVPAYSEIFYGQGNLYMELAVTLAIHNTDLDAPIIIQSVRYYDTNGQQVRDYISDPVEVPPLATTGFLLEGESGSGGWGANFIVEWGAEEPVYEPIIEAIMVSTRGTHGLSMISPGRVLSQNFAAPAVEATPDVE